MSSIMREDWIEVELGEVCDKAENVKRKEIILSDTFKYFDIGGINNKTNRIVSFKEYSWENAPSRAQQIIKKGDILFSTVRTYLKNIAQVDKDDYDNQICSSGFTVIRGINESIIPNYIFYYSFSVGFLNPLSALQTGSSYPAVRDKDVFSQIFPLAPLPIQRAIVSKIEALFSDLDNGIANFKKAQSQLKIYRQAVLKKAFEGKLSELGKEGLKDDRIIDKDNKYKEILQSSNPKNPNSDNKGDNLPKGWKWMKISDVCDMKAGYFIKADEINSVFENGLFPCYGGNGLRGYVKSTTHEGLFPIVGRQGALCGNVHLVNGKFHATEHAVVVTAKKEIDIKCLYYKLIEMKINQYATGTAQPGLSVNKILPIEIIYPSSLQEQTQIVQEIESRLSVCDKVEQSISESIIKAEALRQSILKKAFEGRLLSEAEVELCKAAADYEPASELLKKIKAEKLATLRQAQDAKKKKPIVKKKSKK